MEAVLFNRRLQSVTAFYSFFWMLAANLVGLWMAALLLWPEAGAWTGSLGYGRWMPLHMDWHLYGWCSLPLVGLLFHTYLVPERGSVRHLHAGYIAWSLGLLLAGIMCLLGLTSGKLFLDWSGPSRVLFPVAQVFLWMLLVGHFLRRWRERPQVHLQLILKGIMLLVLLASPIALYITSGRSVYPPIDPESGGATGHSLLASTLGVIALFGIAPRILGIGRTSLAVPVTRLFGTVFLLSLLGWAFLDHGNASNTQAGQVAGLAILLVWIPVVALYYLAHEWTEGQRPWMLAFLFWWLMLTISGFISFLPPVLELLKFTNGLVAHAHLAMAGMITSFNMVVLASMAQPREKNPWVDSGGFWLWQTGCFIYVVSMLVQGVREGHDPYVLYAENTITNLLYGLRFLAGLLMLVASFRWIALTPRNETV